MPVADIIKFVSVPEVWIAQHAASPVLFYTY